MNRPQDPDVSDALELYNICKEFNSLPGPGGVLNQDSYYTWVLGLVASAVSEKEKRDMESQRKRR